MASTKLTRTFSADSNRKKFTVSVWVKKSQHASAKVIWGGEISTGYVWLNMGSTIYFQQNPVHENIRMKICHAQNVRRVVIL